MYKKLLKEFKEKKICNLYLFFLFLFFVSLPVLIAGFVCSNTICSIIGGFGLALSSIYCHMLCDFSELKNNKRGD